jgi:hypothetical protein
MSSDHRWLVSLHVLGLRLDFTLRPWTRLFSRRLAPVG